MVNQKQFRASLLLSILLLRLVSWLHIGCNDSNVQNYKLLNNHNSMLQNGHVYFIRNNLQSAFYATVSCSRLLPHSDLRGGVFLGEHRADIAGDKIEKNEMGWACGAYG